ncbi:hypothetical protein RSAG8_05442, partial [Rhizoctonia solani AG-8 WAC10335]
MDLNSSARAGYICMQQVVRTSRRESIFSKCGKHANFGRKGIKAVPSRIKSRF